MSTNDQRKRPFGLGIGLLAVILPAIAIAGVSPQGVSPQGVSPQGVSPQGVSPQGVSPQGVSPQGVSPQGVSPQGVSPQGVSPQGVSPQGVSPQGVSPQGVVLMGTDLLSADGKGVLIKSVDIHGTTSSSAKATATLTRIPTMSTGSGNYIAVGVDSAVGHYAVAHLADASNKLVTPAEDLDLFIADGKKDPMFNLFHRFEEQDNEDWVYQVYFFHKWSGQWISLCPYDVNTKMASSIALPVDDPPGGFVFACTATGVASKCARNWGYRPWADTTAWVFSGGTWALQTFGLKDYYNICVNAAMAGYCQDSKSYTKTGTLVDLFDTRQIIWPNAIENPFSSSNPESQWMMAQEYFISTGSNTTNALLGIKDSGLQRSRYRELSPSAECDKFAFVDRLERDHIEDGRWANPLTNTPRLQVFSPTYCTHDEYHEGDAMPWDCSPCTTQVCKTHPECCGASGTPHWGPTCITEAQNVCKTGADQWPAGRVWPTNMETSSILPKYLFGPQGVVLRVDGTSGTGSSATVAGWACDPEWPDATVAVAIYDAPRETVAYPLAVVRADQALTSPIAREVSAACDGPGRDYARHGFSYTLPENQSGNVFVYALDEETDDGKPAPATLIRNGIIHVPRCAHSEHVVGAALEAGCSTCAGTVCGSDATCCSTAWTDACADLANACAATDSSAPGNSRVFAAVTTGWIEAPSDGSYTFDSSVQPSRLFINGKPVLDWFETASPPGTKTGNITLKAGQKYHLRWDRLQAEPPLGSGPGLTWQPPGAVGQVSIPSGNLYALAPGGGSGLKASYFDDPGLTGTEKDRLAPAPDPFVDINTNVQPPSPIPALDIPTTFALPYSAKWEGEMIPSFSEDYTFHVVGTGVSTFTVNGVAVPVIAPPANTAPGGCAHDLCELGGVLDPSCNTCVHKVCDHDDFCCNGGYLSYYSFGPTWDSKCIAEVNQWCSPGLCSTPPLDPTVIPQKKLGPVTLKAGVRYSIELIYDSDATSKTIQLMWSSARQIKQVIPQFALYPRDPGASARGAGLNVTYFGTTSAMGVVKPDLYTVVAAGFVTDFALTPTIGQSGTPLIDLLAAPSDTTAATPPPPMVARPRYADEVSDTTPQIKIAGIGGLPGGTVRIGLESDPTVEVIATVQGNGTFTATVPVGSYSTASTPPLPKVLRLLQRAPGATCVVPTTGECSYEVTWPVMVIEATAATKPPTILSPSDPTHSPPAVDTSFPVVGTGTIADLHVTDQGSFPVLPVTITPLSDGTFSGSITLTTGTPTEPLKGWHKLIFDQGGTASPPVFVSVGIDPPTVEFPRSGAELDCNEPEPPFPPPARGTIPYPEDKLGPLRVFEETGRQDLLEFGAKTRIIQPPQGSGDPIRFETRYDAVGPGRHVLVFFQAPDPPTNATPAERAAHFRAFSSIADTPTSRIAVDIRPPRFPIPPGQAVIFGGRTFGDIKGPPPGTGPLPLAVADCGPNANPRSDLCALPFADVNVRLNGRLFTARADADGAWSTTLPPLPLGWNRLTLAQVVDSAVGGAWKESCESNDIGIGVRSPGGPIITVPADFPVDAESAAGTRVFYPDVTAVKASDGASVPVDCAPAAGSMFRIGTTSVLCSATDPDTGAVGLGEFAVTVVDQPPTIQGFDVVAEADQLHGIELNSYPIIAHDAVDRDLLLDCIPATPNLFLIDEITPVFCSVTDSAGKSASTQFTVRVVDTTPPTLCPLSDIMVGTNAGAGATVSFAACASDIVDGADVPIDCGPHPPSGSFFPFGTTVVKCAATDKHGNRSEDTFTVSVGDTTPPVLNLPNVVTAFATSRNGARVNFTVTATDNIDPNPKVKCTPPSGSQFPLGSSTVTCTATDSSGNSSQRTFKVRVIVKWSGLLPPIPADGTGVFNQGSTIPTMFSLVGESADICDLTARLYVAPVDAAGNVGTEKPAKSRPPGKTNVFAVTGASYHLNLDTGPMAVGRWQLRVDLGDGEPHPTLIKLR